MFCQMPIKYFWYNDFQKHTVQTIKSLSHALITSSIQETAWAKTKTNLLHSIACFLCFVWSLIALLSCPSHLYMLVIVLISVSNWEHYSCKFLQGVRIFYEPAQISCDVVHAIEFSTSKNMKPAYLFIKNTSRNTSVTAIYLYCFLAK